MGQKLGEGYEAMRIWRVQGESASHAGGTVRAKAVASAGCSGT